MKRLLMLPLLFAFVSLSVLLPSCVKDDPADAASGKVTATVGAQSWENKAGADGAVYLESMGSHLIQAYHEDGSYIGLTIFGTVTAGSTFVTDAGLFQAQYKPDFLATEAFVTMAASTPGTITFTTFNSKTIKGTFSFTGRKIDGAGGQTDIEVKNGSFEFNF
ncbi:MAG: hypothetical protein WA004_14195 [Saprospiraceae bacterium]